METNDDLMARVEVLEGEVAELKARLDALTRKAAAVPSYTIPRRPNGAAAVVLAALKELGGQATVMQLRQQLPAMPHSSLRRACHDLRRAGKIAHVVYGEYRVVSDPPKV